MSPRAEAAWPRQSRVSDSAMTDKPEPRHFPPPYPGTERSIDELPILLQAQLMRSEGERAGPRTWRTRSDRPLAESILKEMTMRTIAAVLLAGLQIIIPTVCIAQSAHERAVEQHHRFIQEHQRAHQRAVEQYQHQRSMEENLRQQRH